MSLKALTWAFDTEIESSSCKFVLVALADYASDEGECYPSIETMVRKTSLNRKTIISCLDKLVLDGYLADSGDRKGKTQQVKVYKILKESQNRNSSVFTRKESQKRDIEPSGEPSVKKDEERRGFEERAKSWFKKKPSTQLDKSETNALKSAFSLKIPSCDLELLDWWFGLKPGEAYEKFKVGSKTTFSSALNSIQGEIEKARMFYKPSAKKLLVNEKPPIILSDYLLWLDSQDYGDRMKPEWRKLETAPKSLIDSYLEFTKAI